jgi:hypothetical protein
MTTNRKIQVGSLEFDEIKASLKEFLKGQSQFSDYDFEGSNMSILLDILTANTYYNNIYTNMAINETFLDTASKRSSVVSRAKELGYTPRSYTCAKTTANFVVTNADVTVPYITLPKYSTFSGIKDSVKYTFYTTQDYTAGIDTTDPSVYKFSNVEIIEGSPIINRFVYSSVDNATTFILPNPNIDTETLTVRVQEPPSTLYETYLPVSNFADVDENSKVYYLGEKENGEYELSFGDGILGKALVNGNIITTNYMVSNGSGANGISNITYTGPSLGTGTIENLTITSAVYGGREAETTEEIRYNAPNFYASQNRIVTALDYETFILNRVSSIKAVSVWGGETMVPPVYGKVYISAQTTSGKTLTYQEQQDIITDYINPYKMVTIIPEFINPEYINVELNVVAYYDPTLTAKSAGDLITSITSTMLYMNVTELQQFNRILRGSYVSRKVEEVDPCITSCVPRMKMHRTVTPIYNVATNYDINIGNPFEAGSIISTPFFIDNFGNVCYIDDDSQGNLLLYTLINGVRYDLRNTGTVDYEHGRMVINNLNIVRLSTGSFVFTINPSSSDIVSMNNQIVQLDVAKLAVSLVVDETNNGRIYKGNRYEFTPIKI